MRPITGWKRKSAVAAAVAWVGIAAVLAPFPQADPLVSAAGSAAASFRTLQTNLKPYLDRRESRFTISYSGTSASLSIDMDKAIQSILDADDSLGYTVSSYRWTSSVSKNDATIQVAVQYWENAKQTDYVVSRTKQIAKEIIKPGMNAHQKVKAVHDWILLNVAYDRTLVQHSAYAALTRGFTVCQGYALLAYRLLNEAGIENRIAEGTVSTGLHAWNLVKLDGKWYHLDTTFDDPVPDEKGRKTYNYYLITDKQIRKDHQWTKTYPAAVTSYAAVLNGLKTADKKNAEFYGSLEEQIGYPLLKAENTVKSLDELAVKITAAKKAGKNAINVRWTGPAAKLDLKLLLKMTPVLSSISTSTTPFPLGEPGDCILKVDFS